MTRPSRTATDEAKPGVRPLLAVLLAVVLVVVVFVRLDEFSNEPSVSIELSLRETIYVTALALDAEHDATGRYPPDLETIGMDEEGLAYSLVPDGYVLVATEQEHSVEFRSGDELDPFRAAFEELLPPYDER